MGYDPFFEVDEREMRELDRLIELKNGQSVYQRIKDCFEAHLMLSIAMVYSKPLDITIKTLITHGVIKAPKDMEDKLE